MGSKKKIIIAACVFSALFLAVPGTGLAYFYFGLPHTESNESAGSNGNAKINNVKDNYASREREEEYTIYFFPSSIYMYEYEKYLSSGGQEGSLPELLFNDEGTDINPMALEYRFDEAGSLSYEATTKADYSLLISQADEYIDYIQDLCETIGADNTVASGHYENTLWHYQAANLAYDAKYLTSSSQAVFYGDKRSDEAFDFEDSRTKYDSGHNALSDITSDRFSYIYRFLYDRFGHWPSKNAKVPLNTLGGEYGDESNGRFSPIKITVENGLDFNLYNSIPIPRTAMSDGYTGANAYYNGPNLTVSDAGDYQIADGTSVYQTAYEEWFDLSFSNWSFLSPAFSECFYDRYAWAGRIEGWNGRESTYNAKLESDSPVYEADYLLDPFRGVDCANIFDLTKDLSYYADENNIIRLFPIFSNGKSYNATATNIDSSIAGPISDPNLSHGGLASARIEYYDDRYNSEHKRVTNYTYNGDSAYMVTKSRGADSDINADAFSWVYYSSAKNFYYDPANISGISFSCAANSSGLSEYADYRANSDIDSFLNGQMSAYGEGLYNLYFFYTHTNIASISKWAKVPNDGKDSYYYNGNTIQGKGYFDNYVLSGGAERYFYGPEIDAAGNKTSNYKLCGLWNNRGSYNFFEHTMLQSKSTYIYMNYLLQTNGGTTNSNGISIDGYYKDTSTDYLTDESGNALTYADGTKKKTKAAYYHNTFEQLDSNDLIFMPAGKNDITGTYYGGLTNSMTSGENNVVSNWPNSQIVVAIEKVNDIRFVEGTYDSSTHTEYPIISDTYRNSYKQTGSSFDLLLLDPKRTFVLFNQYLSYGQPLHLVDGKNNELELNLPDYTAKLYFDIDASAVSSENDIESYNVFHGASSYISQNSSGEYAISGEQNEGTYDMFFYRNDSDQYEVYLHRRALSVKLFADDGFKKSLDDDGFLDLSSSSLSSSLLWEGSFNYVQSASDQSNPLGASSLGSGNFASLSFGDAISSCASSTGYEGGYIIRDYATNIAIGYYYRGNVKFFFNASNDGAYHYVIKTSVLYLEEENYTM